MLNTQLIFAYDDSISLLSNELFKIRNKLQSVLDLNDDFHNNETIVSLVAKRNNLVERISDLQIRRQKLMEK